MNTKVLVINTFNSFPVSAKLEQIFNRWRVNISTRHKLLDMDDDRLKDIGIDREAAMIEGRKPFWC